MACTLALRYSQLAMTSCVHVLRSLFWAPFLERHSLGSAIGSPRVDSGGRSSSLQPQSLARTAESIRGAPHCASALEVVASPLVTSPAVQILPMAIFILGTRHHSATGARHRPRVNTVRGGHRVHLLDLERELRTKDHAVTASHRGCHARRPHRPGAAVHHSRGLSSTLRCTRS